MSDEGTRVTFGETLYNEHGEQVGTVRGFDEHGFYVTTLEGIAGLSIEHLRAGHEFGEAELMWRCRNCGEMDDLVEEFPEACPSCDAPKEELYYFIED